jgi:hypothetical protein
MNHPRRSMLKWLAALPFVGVMIPQAQARQPTFPPIPEFDEGRRRHIIAYRALQQLLPGLWDEPPMGLPGTWEGKPHFASRDLVITVNGDIDLLIDYNAANSLIWTRRSHRMSMTISER